MVDEECIFCKIASGKVPCNKVFENSTVLAFLDAAPVNPGHVLVIPKLHFETILDVPDVVLAETFKAVKKISVKIMKAAGAEGFNIGINTFKTAGQLVQHFHIHIIPRFENDGIEPWPQRNYEKTEAEEIAEKIKEEIKK